MMEKQKPDFQRVLVLQGGGSLGAYEAGVFQAMCEMLTKEDTKRGFKGRPLADIVAGTSIGAINSTILVSYVIENNTWEGSSERLNEFWEYLSKESLFDHIPGFTQWWDYLHNNVNHDISTGEAARRYIRQKSFRLQAYLMLSLLQRHNLILNSLILKIYGIALTVLR